MNNKNCLNPNEKISHDNLSDLNNDSLDLLIKSECQFAFDSKHNGLTFSRESNVINKKKITECPYCGSTSFMKNGFTKSRIQKYKCKNCLRSFTPTTNTLLANHKLSLEQHIEFLINLFRYQNLNSLSYINKNSMTTSRLWLEKIFLILKNYQDNLILSGDIYFDEIYITKNKNTVSKNKGAKKNESSITQFCIGVACDNNYVYAKIESRGKPSYKSTSKCFEGHFQPRSKIIHDCEIAHNAIFRKHTFVNCTYNIDKQGENKAEYSNLLNPIKKQCLNLKTFLKIHCEYDEEHLQDYLNLFCFIQTPPKDLLLKSKILLNAYFSLPLTLRYRDFYNKNSKDSRKYN